jgi:SAM-dependent methyltransferase
VAQLLTGYHDAHLLPDPARRIVWEAIAAHLARWIPPHASVVELGAGYCDWINNVRAARRVAVDLWPSFPSHAAPGVEPIVLDAATELWKLDEGSFDVALASNVLEHFAPDVVPEVVAGIARLLRTNGRILVIQPNFRYAAREYFDDYTHRSVFTHISLPALLRAHGFAIDLVQPRFLPYSMRGTRLPIARWLVSTYLRSPIRPRAGQMLVVATKT